MTLLDQLDNIRNFYFTIFLETKTKIVTLPTFHKEFFLLWRSWTTLNFFDALPLKLLGLIC